MVEGPPGTGKSHTITAIAADCALSGRSCLILSDKMEALNVVQSKLSDAMNQARHDKNFPNPLLRLGQEQTNFKRLTSNQALTAVSAYVRAAKTRQPHLQAELKSKREKLRGDIEKTVECYQGIGIGSIGRAVVLDQDLERTAPGLGAKLELVATTVPTAALDAAYASVGAIGTYLRELFAEQAQWTSDALIICQVSSLLLFCSEFWKRGRKNSCMADNRP